MVFVCFCFCFIYQRTPRTLPRPRRLAQSSSQMSLLSSLRYTLSPVSTARSQSVHLKQVSWYKLPNTLLTMSEGLRFFEHPAHSDRQILTEKRETVNRLLICEWVGAWKGGGGGWPKIKHIFITIKNKLIVIFLSYLSFFFYHL